MKFKHLLTISLLFTISSCGVLANTSSGFKNKDNEGTGATLLHEDGYAYLSNSNHKTYFVFMGISSKGKLTTEDIKLVDENKTMVPEKIEYDNSVFSVYFDLTTFFGNQTSSISRFYPHLYIKDSLWEGYQYGDLLSSDGGNLYSPSYTYISEGNHQYYLSAISPSYPMCQIFSYIDIDLHLKNTNDFAYFTYEDSHYYYNLDGYYESDITLNKRSLSIKDGNKGSYDCTVLNQNKEDNITHFTAKFELDEMINKMTVNDDNRQYATFEPHLYFNGDAFDNKLGYVTNGLSVNSSSVTIDNTYFRISTDETNKRANILATQVLSIQTRNLSLTTEEYTNEYPVDLYIKDDKVIFSVTGHFYGTYGNYAIAETSLSLRDTSQGQVNNNIVASSILIDNPGEAYGGGSRFKAEFDITNANTNSTNNFWTHLYFMNQPFDGDKGDFKPGAYRDDPDWTFKMDVTLNGKKYMLFSCYGMAVFDIQ